MLSNNPGKTLSIERRWIRELKHRYKRLQVTMIKDIRTLTKGHMIITNQQLKFDFEQKRQFMTAFEARLDRLLKGSWQDQYIADLVLKTTQVQEAVEQELITPVSFGFSEPSQQQTFEFIRERVRDSLNQNLFKLGNDVKQSINAVNDLQLGTMETYDLLRSKVKISEKSAMRIARTETTQTQQRTAINRAIERNRMGDTDGEIKLRWVSAKDSRVRDLHRRWHGEVMKTEEALKAINESPWNCRCALIQLPPRLDTKSRQSKFDKERRQLLALDKRSG